MSSQNKHRLVASCPATATSSLGPMELLREKVDDELAASSQTKYEDVTNAQPLIPRTCFRVISSVLGFCVRGYWQDARKVGA
jgi:hypothetical protein